MRPRIATFLAVALIAVSGCESQGVGTIGPPPGETRKDDSFLIPGYNPNAAAALKTRKKGKSAPKIAAEPSHLKDQRH
jgi:hypothetical protein